MPRPRVIEPKVNENRNIVPLEDMTIFVDLIAHLPSRSLIRNKDIKSVIDSFSELKSNPETTVKFLFPVAESENKRPSLTTSWTNIGGKSKEKTTEGFGITNIDIQFDASFVPRVTIDFVDIRGAGLFDQGEDSPYYRSFFHLPYPLFILKFKGYYGDAVSYPLHLMKFNSRFNGENGNFEIKCEFIGHTFALLSDMLLGFALTAPYMQEGGKEECCSDTKYTIKDFIQQSKKVTNEIEKIQDTEAFDSIQKLNELKSEINKDLRKLINEKIDLKPINVSNFVQSNIISEIPKDNSINRLVKRIINSYSDDILEKNLKKQLSNFIAKNEGGKYILNGLSLTRPLVTVPSTQPITETTQTQVINWGIYDTLIDGINETLNNLIKENSSQISAATNKVLEDNDFKEEVKIKNTIETILCGFEIFLNKLRNISKEADENRPNRKKLIKLNSQVENTNEVYPFPLISEVKANGNEVLVYPGSQPKLSRIPEVRFVDEFVEALYQLKEKLNTQSRLLNTGDGWSPVNLLESPLFGDVEDPYSDKKEIEILKRLFSRILVLLSYSYPLSVAVGNRDDSQISPDVTDIIGKRAINELATWTDKWEIWKDDITGLVNIFAQAEATIFFESKVSKTIIDGIISLGAPGIIEKVFNEYNVETGTPFNTDGSVDTYLAKAEDGLKVKTVKESEDSNTTYQNEGDESNVLYYCTNTNSLNQSNNVDISVMSNVSLNINDNKTIYGSFSGGTVFNLESRKTIEQNTQSPKNNEELSDVYNHWYSFGVDDKSEEFLGDRVKLTEFNVLGNTNQNDGVYNKIPWLTKPEYFKKQGFGEREDYWENKILNNVKLESTDSEDDNPLLLNKSSSYDIYYGDFPLYIDEAYYGQIQDTNFYKLNNSLTGSFIYNAVDYRYSDTNTAYLFLQTLYVDFLSDNYFKMFETFSGLMKVPQVWSLWIGATLWRNSHRDNNNNNVDPIQYGNTAVLNGTTNTKVTDFTGGNRLSLGIHFDYLVNNSKYDGNLTGYTNDEIIIPDLNSIPTNVDTITAPLHFFTSDEFQVLQYTSTSDSDFEGGNILYTLFSLPQSIKDQFISLFLEWTKNGDRRIETNWARVKDNIEDKSKIKRHFFNTDEFGIVLAEDYGKKEVTYKNKPNSDRNVAEYYSVRTLGMNTKKIGIKIYDNVGLTPGYDIENDTTNDDVFAKAFFVGGYFNGVSLYPNLTLYEGTLPDGLKISDRGYDFQSNYTLPKSGSTQFEIYSKKIRFLNSNVKDLLDVSQSYMYMLNGSWRNFLLSRDSGILANDLKEKPSNENLPTFYANEGTITQYLTVFIDKLIEVKKKKEEDKQETPKNMLNDNDLKLDIYLKFKNLYDKWISTKLLEEDGKICLSRYFQYVDRAMNDIGEQAVINPKSVMQLLDNSQTSLYNILYELLSQNNFDFFPLPHFNGFGANNDKIVRMFERVLTVEKTKFEPSFVCIFVGDRASTVKFGGSDFGNNVVDFEDPIKTPPDMGEDGKVSAFKVTFGLENQNIFKSISLDQSDYKETAESLQVIDDLSKGGSEVNAVAFKGQDLFQVYNKRSYNCNVEMLGCAVVEPMTYFQLSNVPMFTGAYMIHQVSHNITPNHMTTNFTGVRIPYSNVPIVTDYAVAIGLLDDDNIDATGGVKPDTKLDEDGNTVTNGNKKDQGTTNNVRSGKDWVVVEIPKDDNGEVEIINVG